MSESKTAVARLRPSASASLPTPQTEHTATRRLQRPQTPMVSSAAGSISPGLMARQVNKSSNISSLKPTVHIPAGAKLLDGKVSQLPPAFPATTGRETTSSQSSYSSHSAMTSPDSSPCASPIMDVAKTIGPPTRSTSLPRPIGFPSPTNTRRPMRHSFNDDAPVEEVDDEVILEGEDESAGD